MFFYCQPKETSQQSRYDIQITITETKKVGDGMNAYMTYKVVTKVCGICEYRYVSEAQTLNILSRLLTSN